MMVRMIKIIVITWLLALHAFALLAVWDTDLPYRIDRKLGLGLLNPPEITLLYEDMLGSHLQLDGSVMQGSIIFLGDSLTQGLNVAAVANASINYGIGMDTSWGLLKRVPQYKSLNRASTIVIAIGINDLLRTSRSPADIVKNYQHILSRLPKGKAILIQAAFPADEEISGLTGINQTIFQLNKMLHQLAKERDYQFVNLWEQFTKNDGSAKKELYIEDGLHLSTKGYQLWIQALKQHLSSKRD